MSFLESVRKRGAAALGVAAIASAATLTVQGQEDLTARGEAFVTGVYQSSLSALRGQHPATHQLETPAGPVTFFLNQADEGSRLMAHDLNTRGSSIEPDQLNSFSREDQARFVHALEQLSSTKSGIEVLTAVAQTSNGEVYVGAIPHVEGTAMNRTRFERGEDGEFHMRHASDKAIHIGYDPHAVDESGVTTLAYIGADGKMHRATLDRVLAHELRHGADLTDSTHHHDHGHGKTYAYDLVGHVTDLAMNAGNRHHREMNGGAPDALQGTDRVYYDKVELATGQASLEGQAELVSVIARDERASWGMLPGYSPDRLFPPTAATLGVLKLGDEAYLTHVREFAKDVAIEASLRGGGAPDRAWVEKIGSETDAGKIIAATNPFVARAMRVEETLGDTVDPSLTDMQDHLRIAGMMADYRKEFGGAAARDALPPIEGLAEAVRTDPQEALELYQGTLQGGDQGPPSHDFLDGVLAENGTHARLSAFMSEFDGARRDRASERVAPYLVGKDTLEIWDLGADYSAPLYNTGQRGSVVSTARDWKERLALMSQAEKVDPEAGSDREAPKRIAISLGPNQAAAPVAAGSAPTKGVAPKAPGDAEAGILDRDARVRAKAAELAAKRHASQRKLRHERKVEDTR